MEYFPTVLTDGVEAIITFSMQENNDKWKTLLTFRPIEGNKERLFSFAFESIPDDVIKLMLDASHPFDERVFGGATIESREPGEPIILLKRRPKEKTLSNSWETPISDAKKGIIVWLGEVK